MILFNGFTGNVSVQIFTKTMLFMKLKLKNKQTNKKPFCWGKIEGREWEKMFLFYDPFKPIVDSIGFLCLEGTRHLA
jgi:hypothetical protein